MHKFLIKSIENDRIYLSCKIIDTLSDTKIFHNINAIIDTGAMISAISKKKAKELGLYSLGKSFVRDAAGDGFTNDYYLNLYLNDFIVEKLKVSTFPNHLADFIIGMDILGKGCFSFKKRGKEFVFLYRISDNALKDLNINNKILYRKHLIEQSWIDILNDDRSKNEVYSIGNFFIHCIDLLIQRVNFFQETKNKVEFWKSQNLCEYIVHLLKSLIEPNTTMWEKENITIELEEKIIQPLLDFDLIRKENLNESYLSFQYAISDNGLMFLEHLADKFK